MKIAKLRGREIYNACGMPTVECELFLEDGTYVTASVPAGCSISHKEATPLYDKENRNVNGGVSRAVNNIDEIIAPALIGKEPSLVNMDVEMIDLDGTANKSKLGANAMLATSMAVLRAQAAVEQMEIYELVGYLCEYSSITLPYPMFNCISGGAHANNKVRIQEMMVIPIGAQNFRSSMEAAVTLHHYLHELLKKNFSCVGTSIEGALTANFDDDAQALEYLMQAIESVQKKVNCRFLISIDVAASQFYERKSGKYNWFGKSLASDDLIKLYERLAKQYPIFSIEDGLSEFDTQGWQEMTLALKDSVQIIGDDIFASTAASIANGIEQHLATGAIIKPNQVGTLTEALQAAKLCKDYDLLCVFSHRSCETNDTLIVDLAVGTSAGYIKAGGVARGEHIAKYNALLAIEDSLMLSLLES